MVFLYKSIPTLVELFMDDMRMSDIETDYEIKLKKYESEDINKHEND